MLKKYLNKKNIVIVFIVVLIILFLLYNNRSNKEYSSSSSTTNTYVNSSSNIIVVQISGEVMKPGVYEIISPARVYELINLAGGFTNQADVTNINLVTWLEDGSFITINKINKTNNNESNNKISINSASLEELQTLPQIGLTKAQAIISYRDKNGRFSTIEQILNVSGISQAIYNNIKDLICV